NFGGRFSRMRDVEIADVYGDGADALAVATHDQGIVAILRPDDQGGFAVQEIDREPDTFVHEIETGDLDGDGVVEVYATPSEPNRLDGRAQKGSVVRYVPAKDEGRVVVADLGMRHAKEILVDDVDGDGRDELYVAVEGEMDPETTTLPNGEEIRRLAHGVEIRRFDAGTDPSAGVTVAEIPDRLSRFLTAGDIDGDGQKEMVVATFSQGLWLLRPGPDGQWELQSFDKKSGGFEHASILADLDEDGLDELYVASDNEKLVRQYRWKGNRLVGRVIYRRKDPGSVFTWNVMPVPVELVPR
ncbi:MAG: VCBS repeat-containing protein, partial [Myxococcota bacterium]|nr:VCBS repeat-containing protein [Myxococcota bacterium]